jgi:hypothetical protein
MPYRVNEPLKPIVFIYYEVTEKEWLVWGKIDVSL